MEPITIIFQNQYSFWSASSIYNPKRLSMTQIFCGPIETYHFHLNLRFHNGYVLICAHTPQDALSKKKKCNS